MTQALPWTDCKVAFDLDNEEALFHASDAGTLKLPAGWSLDGTDGSGARRVVLFRIDVLPTIADGEAVAAILAEINKPAPVARVFEVTGAGFDGGTDETDDRVYWVLADSSEQVAEAIKDCGALIGESIAEEDCEIDFDLTRPGQAMALGTKLLEWASIERNKNRAA